MSRIIAACITKITNILIKNAEDFATVMRVYNLLESGSLWNYYRDEITCVDDDASNGIGKT